MGILEFRSRLRRLAELAPQLNATTDEANLVIKNVEDFMKGLNLGIATEVPIDSEHRRETDGTGRQHSVEYFRMLAFERYGQNAVFRLVVKRGIRTDAGGEKSEEVGGITPLAESTRHEKLLSMVALIPLLEALTSRAEAIEKDAAAAVRSVKELLGALPPQMPSLSEVFASKPRAGSFLDVAQHTPGATGGPAAGGVVGRVNREALSSLLERGSQPKK